MAKLQKPSKPPKPPAPKSTKTVEHSGPKVVKYTENKTKKK